MNKTFNKKAKIGLSVICATVILLAVLVLVNYLIGMLPANVILLDASENKMYSISDNAKASLSAVNDSVTLYLLTAGGEKSLNDMGIHLDAFLKKLASHGKNISYELVDLYASDNFLENRGIDSSTVTLNSIVVESELRNRYIDSSELFYYYIENVGKVSQNEAQLYQMYYGMSSTYCFEGEGLILSSVSYVTSKELPLATALTGHGETALSGTLTKEFTNLGLAHSLLDALAIVPGSDMLIINNPTSDVSESEASIMREYLTRGGKLFLVTAPGTSTFSNLCSVLKDFGLYYEDGIILDEGEGAYYQYPYYLLTSSTLLPFSHGITVESVADIETEILLSTSYSSYIIPTDATTTVKPDGQESTSHNVGVTAKNKNGGAIVWISSQMFLDESVSSAIGGGNFNLVSSLSASLCGAEAGDGASSTPLTLITEKLEITPVSTVLIAFTVVGIIPIATIVLGVIRYVKRKNR